MKRYLFFLRHYNDIDNISPAIYFFLDENKENQVDVILYDEKYDYRSDENLLFLKKVFSNRFTFNWIGTYLGIDPNMYFSKKDNIIFQYKTYIIKKIFNTIFIKIKYLLKIVIKKIELRYNLTFQYLKKIKNNITKHKKNNYVELIYNIRIGNPEVVSKLDGIIKIILFKKSFPKLVIFDINRSSQIKGYLKVLKNNGIKRIICLPVSPLINYNTLRNYKYVNLKSDFFLSRHDYCGIDKIGFVDDYFEKSFNKTFELLELESTIKNKTKYIGSIRYCSKWQNIKESFIPVFKRDTKKIKTVFFLSNLASNVNIIELNNIIEFLNYFPEYDVVIKSHPREKSNLNNFLNYSNITFVSNVNSTSLINWADVILFWSSSIAIEGYIKNKIMVCLSYISCNKNLFDLFDAGYIVRCRDDLHEFLEKFKKDKNKIIYNYKGSEKLVNEVIIPNDNKVINNYLEFMKENEFQ